MASALLRRDIDDLDVGILMVPLRGDAFKRQAKTFGLAGAEWNDAEVHGFRIGAGGFQHLHRDVFTLCELPYVVLEGHLDNHVRDGLVPRVGDRPVYVADGRSDKVFGGAHFEIGKLEACRVRRRSGRALWLAAEKKREDDGNGDDDHHGDGEGAPAGIRFFCCWGWLNETAHASRLYSGR